MADLFKGKAQKGTCPVCLESRYLDKDGSLRKHRDMAMGGQHCPGSEEEPLGEPGA